MKKWGRILNDSAADLHWLSPPACKSYPPGRSPLWDGVGLEGRYFFFYYRFLFICGWI